MRKLVRVFLCLVSLIGFLGCGSSASYSVLPPQTIPDDTLPVQFCSAVTGSYGTFPEYGLCIEGNLYAVYWSGSQAFFSKLYPGNYTTTSTGLNCNFTVAPNCSVTDY